MPSRSTSAPEGRFQQHVRRAQGYVSTWVKQSAEIADNMKKTSIIMTFEKQPTKNFRECFIGDLLFGNKNVENWLSEDITISRFQAKKYSVRCREQLYLEIYLLLPAESKMTIVGQSTVDQICVS